MKEELRKEYFEKAFKLHNAGKIPEALNFYGKILKENPDDCEILNLVGISNMQQRNYDEAEKYVLKAISVKNVRYFYEILANIYYEQKLYKKALDTRLEEEKIFWILKTLKNII